MQPFELIAAVPESSHRVHVKRVLALADGGDPFLHLGDVDLLVGLAAIIYSREEAEGAAQGWVPCYGQETPKARVRRTVLVQREGKEGASMERCSTLLRRRKDETGNKLMVTHIQPIRKARLCPSQRDGSAEQHRSRAWDNVSLSLTGFN